MKSLLLIFISCVYLYGFFWGDVTRFENSKGVTSGSKNIDLYYTIEAKKQVEYIQTMALLSLNATHNDTINDKNIITYRTIPHISDLYANLATGNGKSLDTRSRVVFNSIDKSLVEHENYANQISYINVYDNNFSILCSDMVDKTEFSKMYNNHVTQLECINADARYNDFYGASVFLLDIPNEDILKKYETKIQFDDSLDSVGSLGKNGSVFVSKYKYSISQDQELIQKIRYFTYAQLVEYVNKYISTNKTFLSKQPIMDAMQRRVSVLQENNASVALISLNNLISTYTFNEYSAHIDYTTHNSESCIAQKAVLETIITTYQTSLSLLNTQISDKETDIATNQALLDACTNNLCTNYYQNLLNNLVSDLASLNNDKITIQETITSYQNQIIDLGC